jgi:nucleotide-binding universal stress UspA family protein
VPKTLIVPLDGSKLADRALRSAQRLAAHLGACDIVAMTASRNPDGPVRHHVERLVAEASETSIRAEFVLGPTAASIVRMTQEAADPLVCMSTRGHGRLTTSLLGSVTTAVVRDVESPVLLVGPRCGAEWWHHPAKIVACWARDESNAVLAPAERLGKALGMELWLETVVIPFDARASVEPGREFVPALVALEDPVAIHTVVLHDVDVARAIVHSARKLPATLLAMTTAASAALELGVMGSVTTDVVRRSPCPVVVVRGAQ